MESLKVVVLTNDKHLDLLRPFMYCFRRFWPDQDVEIFGFSQPQFKLVTGFTFTSLGKQKPVDQWGSAVHAMCDELKKAGHSHFVFMLEDYWIKEPVFTDCVQTAWRVATADPTILRVDLTGDRSSHTSSWLHHKTIDRFMFIETRKGVPYQMSFQAGIWNIDLLRGAVLPNETPWQAEINGTKRLATTLDGDCRVLGTLHHPVNYVPVYRANRGGLQQDKLDQYDADTRRDIQLILKGEM